MVRASPPPSDPAASAQPAASLPRRVTLKDIARALKVSPATVSNAYNRPDQLSPQLRARILETALALGYSGPDPLASSLRRGRAGAIGVVYDATLSYAFADPAASLFLGGLARALEEQNLGLLLIPSPQRPSLQRPDAQNARPQEPSLRAAAQPATGRVQSASVDGFVVYSASDGSELLKAVLGRGLPVVLVDQSQVEGVAYIGIDDAGGARAAARHLLDLGHRQIGVLSLEFGPQGPDEPTGTARGTEQSRGTVTPEREAQLSYHTTAERLRAYRGAAAEAGATLFVMEAQDNTPQEAETLALELLRTTPGVTALLCMSDVLAQGALSAARKLGLEVPGSLSVVGFDDVPSSAALGLSSVHQPTAQKGELAGRALVELLAGGAARELILPTQLMVRGSSGPVRK
ncbi:LacI family DNA-binding transcriptional regulator [Deinococcus radiomollis]|uniref:LacI family DNA-binding transcriptional regulator n=1 Tax=Deinococcus radiomollis TaxID=468916 RepID=UPI003892B278